MNRDIMPRPVTQDDAYKPKHTDGELIAAKAEARSAAFLEAAEMAEREASYWRESRDRSAQTDDLTGTLRDAAKTEIASLLAARYGAKAEEGE